MWHLQRIDPVTSLHSLKYIVFTGSGGKTSLMERLAIGFLAAGKRVAITTTTKIYAVEPYVLLDDGGRARVWGERMNSPAASSGYRIPSCRFAASRGECTRRDS